MTFPESVRTLYFIENQESRF